MPKVQFLPGLLMTYKLYGPYTGKNGRKYVVHSNNGIKRSQTYARYLMEQHLGRVLLESEHVDHIDEDCTNDEISNLQLLSLSENSKKSAKLRRSVKFIKFICPVCKLEFSREAWRYKNDKLKNYKSGPFCSDKCYRISRRKST